MDVAGFLRRVDAQQSGRLAHVEELPEREGQGSPAATLGSATAEHLARISGFEILYQHQVAAWNHIRAGRDTVIQTGTASGKSLCYQLPVVQHSVDFPASRSLLLYPTKALAQDQLRGLEALLSPEPGWLAQLSPGVFDGDTPPAVRRRIRAESRVVLSNPDMLHASILPQHAKWSRFFSQLRYIVLDEVHMYRGILGAHVACVLRRLERICRHYQRDARPVVIATSATIANPGELTSQLIGRKVEVVDQDGSPRGRKYFAIWNPQHTPQESGSAQDDASWLMGQAMAEGAQTLAFTRTRQAAELINRAVRERFRSAGSPLHRRMGAYRGGYLPNQRREIERQLSAGELMGVASTNALELGVDIGGLDVVLLVHYPGTIASVWQQAGRSGRRQGDSLAVLIVGPDPIDQYLLRRPDYFFAQTPEHAVADPANPYVLARHLLAAAFELPLEVESLAEFGGGAAAPLCDALEQAQRLTRIDDRYYFSGGGTSPALEISLRHMADNTFSVVQRRPAERRREPAPGELSPTIRGPRPRSAAPLRDGYEVIANVDAISAPELVYPEAIYLHDGETFFVRELDLQNKVAYVERRESDYYTQAILESSVKVIREQMSRSVDQDSHGEVEGRGDAGRFPRCRLGFGEVDVTWRTIGFKKIKFETRENVGFGPVDIPAQNLPTTAFWLTLEDSLAAELRGRGVALSEALCGLRNLAVVALPMIAMCDTRDISGVVDSKNFALPAVILYDRYAGGLGYCEKGFREIETLLEICDEIVSGCQCEEGCPSCVGLPNLRPAIHSDPDLTRGYPIPDKSATVRLIQAMRMDSRSLSCSTTRS